MRLKYHTNQDEKKRQIENSKNTLKKIYYDDNKKVKYQQYQLHKYYEYKALNEIL